MLDALPSRVGSPPLPLIPFIKKVAPRFELGIEALQAPALPLGHVADLVHPKVKPVGAASSGGYV